MSECFAQWGLSLLPENMEGKTVYTTANIECCENPLYIASAQINVEIEGLYCGGGFAKLSENYWLDSQNEWSCLCCGGAINTSFTTKTGTSNEWHYYISSKSLTV